MDALERPPTAFEERIYDAVRLIPSGMVTTYRKLGESVGCGSSQAVGQALRRNPYAPDVPCHRVVRSDRRIGGFAGEVEGPDIERKRALLATEGVFFGGDGKVEAERVFDF